MEFFNVRISPSLCALFFLAVMACAVSPATGFQFKVGAKCGWTLNPDEGYSHWAERNRFKVNDTLYFKYDKAIDSVLIVNKDDYDNCNSTKPLLKLEGGESVFKFDRSGPFFFITSNLTNCQKGQKLVVVVLAIRPRQSPPASPSPSSPAAPIPPYPSPSDEPSASSPAPTKKSSGAAMFGPSTVLFSAVCAFLGLIVFSV